MAGEVPKGSDPARVVNAIIETPLGSRIKYAAGDDTRSPHLTSRLPEGAALVRSARLVVDGDLVLGIVDEEVFGPVGDKELLEVAGGLRIHGT